ncbi:hypothetical protein V6N13_051321 [Hibiscus sabdariffa]
MSGGSRVRGAKRSLQGKNEVSHPFTAKRTKQGTSNVGIEEEEISEATSPIKNLPAVEADNEECMAKVQEAWNETNGSTLEKVKQVGLKLNDWQKGQRRSEMSRKKELTGKVEFLMDQPTTEDNFKEMCDAKK